MPASIRGLSTASPWVADDRWRPDLVVVGAACRDVSPTDPRGWRLGGGVTYGALTTARLGIRTGVLLGVDHEAEGAAEIDLLRAAGARVVLAPLPSGPVFHNEERPQGRVQTLLTASQPVDTRHLPDAWRDAPAWLLAPVAAEVRDAWASVPRPEAYVAFGWQGILRHLYPGERVWPLEPGPSVLLARADLVGVSRHDLPHGLSLDRVAAWLRPRSDLLVTAGDRGGLLLHIRDGRVTGGRHFPSILARIDVDPTGAGDTVLAGLLAVRIAAGQEAAVAGRELRVAAAAASLLVESPGLDAVPTLSTIRERILPSNPNEPGERP
jgi:sugar/nucleoside kinase (ribokinase family)